MFQKGFSKILVLVILVIVVGAVTGVLVWQYKQTNDGNGENKNGGGRIVSSNDKAKTARALSAMGQLRTAALLFYSAEMSYQGLNCNVAEIDTLCDEIQKQTGETPVIKGNIENYCAYVYLPDGAYYYIDSKGIAEKMDTSPAGSGLCAEIE